ncbi:MAG: UvrD-helicase domain-containing protein [Lentisphaeraceae bacterium]|nr:UvrD-helicase domain-containing protein [Lentisphaeraceae bacterium]
MKSPIDIHDPKNIDLSNHSIIEASAGTGKTYTIQNLVVELVQNRQLKLSEILVVTFTEKATGELKERIFSALCEARDKSSIKSEALTKAIEQFSEAKIFTIHSFCQRVLQEFAFENSNSFNFELTDDKELYTRELNKLKRIWNEDSQVCELLRSFYEGSSTDELLIELAQKRTGLEVAMPLTTDSEEFTFLLDSSLRHLRSFSKDSFNSFADTKSITSAKKRYEDIIEPVFSLLNDSSLSDLQVLEHISDLHPKEFKADSLIKKTTSAKAKEDFDSDLKTNPHYTAFSDALYAILSLKKKVNNSPWFTFLLQQSIELKDAVKAYKRSNQLMSFDDMIEDVHHALCVDKSKLLIDSLRESMKVGLIDEFQDTDLRQWAIFQKIFLEDSESTGNRLHLIGDPKQAIYGFRGADINAYLQARHELLEHGASYYNLPTNWRSLPSLIGEFNKLFKSPNWFSSTSDSDWSISYRNSMTQDDVSREKRQSEGPCLYYDQSSSNPLNIVEVDTEDKNAWAIKKSLADSYVSSIQDLVGNVEYLIKGKEASLSYKDICILLRSRSDFAILEKAFRDKNIPYTFYKQTGIFQTQEAYTFYYLFKSFIQPENNSFRTQVYLSSLFDLEPELAINPDKLSLEHPVSLQWLSLRDLAINNKWALFFETLLFKNGLISRLLKLAESHASNTYEQLSNELMSLTIKENLSVDLLTERLLDLIKLYVDSEDDYREKTIEADAIKIMTIHVSKGLEFPVVFLFGGFSTPRVTDKLHKYFDSILQKPVIDITKSSKQEVLNEQNEELIRLYYVACTRAVLKLFVPSIDKKSIINDLFSGDRGVTSTSHEILTKPLTIESESYDQQELTYSFETKELSSFAKRRVGIYSFSSLSHFQKDDEELSFNDDKIRDVRYDDYASLNDSSLDEELILPRGASTGDLLHEILENLDYALLREMSSPYQLLNINTPAFDVISAALNKFPLPNKILRDDSGKVIDTYEKALARMVWNTLKAPILELGGLSLSEVTVQDTQREIEFNFKVPGNESYMTGIIDLLFRIKKADNTYHYYVLDWKTTSIANDDYFRDAIHTSMLQKKYNLQYKLYEYAVQKWFNSRYSDKHQLIGSVYVYLRGMNVKYPGRGVYYTPFNDDALALEKKLNKLISYSQGVKR